jgi:hypothetical protein
MLLEFGVASIAKRPFSRVLAAAEIHLSTRLGGVGFGTHAAPFVSTIAEGLTLTESTGTPVVRFSSFHIDGVGTFLGNLGRTHVLLLSPKNQRRKSEHGLMKTTLSTGAKPTPPHLRSACRSCGRTANRRPPRVQVSD